MAQGYEKQNGYRNLRMRLDSFLKESRIIKRRTVAKSMCDEGYIFIFDKKSKASYEVKPGDEISIYFKQKRVKYRVLDIPHKGTRKSESGKFSEVISEEFYKE